LEKQRLLLDLEMVKLERDKLVAETESYRIEAEKSAFELERSRAAAAETDASEARNNIFTFYSDVNEMTVAMCMQHLGLYTRKDPGSPIEIVFNSPGGYVLDGLALYDYIQHLRTRGHRVTTVGIGMAASMGGVLLQAGDHRVMHVNGFMLIHEVSTIAYGKTSEIKDQQKFNERLQARLLDILSERSTLSKAQIRNRWKKTDWWIGAEECLQYGFVDEVR
jgi:ATP-dependent Clp protease protease subunit